MYLANFVVIPLSITDFTINQQLKLNTTIAIVTNTDLSS
jgi:hypothetical protein